MTFIEYIYSLKEEKALAQLEVELCYTWNWIIMTLQNLDNNFEFGNNIKSIIS